MIGKALARALEDDWQPTLDGILRRRGWPTTADVARLGARVAKLSAAYNDPLLAGLAPGSAELTSARLGFSFARDVPKGAGAVRELVARGLLERRDGGALRVLDVGAGLGATSWGVSRALAAAGESGAVDAVFVDSDGLALDVAMEIVRARGGPLTASVLRGGVDRAGANGRFDLVLLGQVLSELDVGAEPETRVQRHVALIRTLMTGALEEDGALVVIEPALRDRTRHLHRVRDALLGRDATPRATLFAPCLHAAACPALARDGDWCHEDLPVDLPPWLVPVARAAGLRYQGLTFSYLALRKDGKTLAASLRPGALRVVSDAFVTKGKREVFLCGELAGANAGAGRLRAMRLDRDASAGNGAFEDAQRGDVLRFEPALDPSRPRVGRDALVASAVSADATDRVEQGG